MSGWIGKLNKRRNGPRKISNELPPDITEKDGKYYRDGKLLEMKEVSFEEFFGIDPETVDNKE